MDPHKRKIITQTFVVVGMLLVFLLAGCSGGKDKGQMYHCPMHPTYVSDHPGDCPICGMRIVPIEADKMGGAGTSTEPTAAPTVINTASFVCPMDPEVGADQPGRCPKCGMDLVPNPGPQEGAAAPGGVPGMAPIQVSPEGVRLAGVRSKPATWERIGKTIRAVGMVTADETRVRHVHTKVSGWIEKLYANFTGQLIKAGDPMLSFYSQELLANQQELLRARESAGQLSSSQFPGATKSGQTMLEAVRDRLRLLDVPETLIQQVESSGVPVHSVTLVAPISGFVTGKQIYEGHQVEPGMELYVITDLSHVWIEADVYEYEVPLVRLGQNAVLELPYNPGVELSGEVAFIYPVLNPETRTLKIRFVFPNPDLVLKPGMYADVSLVVDASETVVAPETALMDSGLRQVVFVDQGGGRFEPRQVKAGLRGEGKVQLLSGVQTGEQVVTHANFLLDSESKLQAALSGMMGK